MEDVLYLYEWIIWLLNELNVIVLKNFQMDHMWFIPKSIYSFIYLHCRFLVAQLKVSLSREWSRWCKWYKGIHLGLFSDCTHHSWGCLKGIIESGIMKVSVRNEKNCLHTSLEQISSVDEKVEGSGLRQLDSLSDDVIEVVSW